MNLRTKKGKTSPRRRRRRENPINLQTNGKRNARKKTSGSFESDYCGQDAILSGKMMHSKE